MDNNDIVYVVNKGEETYTDAWGGVEYSIKPGEFVAVQRFMADTWVKHIKDLKKIDKNRSEKIEVLETHPAELKLAALEKETKKEVEEPKVAVAPKKRARKPKVAVVEEIKAVE